MADGGRRGGRARIDQPLAPRRGPVVSYDPESFGRTTETIARFLGTGRYLVIQSILIVLWIVYNVAAPKSWQFDPYTFTFLTLILSLQAAYAAPLILLAQNRQDDRDRINMDDDRQVAAQNKAEVEYLAREIAAIRVALGEVATRDFLRTELARLGERERGGGGSGGKKKDKGATRPRESAPATPAAPPAMAAPAPVESAPVESAAAPDDTPGTTTGPPPRGGRGPVEGGRDYSV